MTDEWSFRYDLKAKGLSEDEIDKEWAKNPLANFECHKTWDTLYIGISWPRIKDDEKGAEFKESIEKQMKDIFGEDTVCGTHEEAWHD